MRSLLVPRTLGILLMFFSSGMLIPPLLALAYNEAQGWVFLVGFAITFLSGALLFLPARNARGNMTLREGFLIVVLFWIVLGLYGALPFLLYRTPDISVSNAVFESFSGLTTTGATVLYGLDDMPRALLFYRHLLQWIGGLGLIVLAIAVLPILGVGGMQLFKTVTPGAIRDQKFTPRIKVAAQMLWYIYLALTAACALGYWLAGMSLFDAVCHSFSTISIGGFSTHDENFGYFDGFWIKAVGIFFMLIAATNFSLHFMFFRRRSLRPYLADHELKTFLHIIALVSVLTILYLALSNTLATEEAMMQGAFQAVSFATTTGYTTADFSYWPGFVLYFLILASFIGGCAGSTAGGLKVLRFRLLIKECSRGFFWLIHPRAEAPLKFSGKIIPEATMRSVWRFFFVYILVFFILMLFLLALGLQPDSAFSAAAAMLNNLGPGLNEVGANYALVSAPGKWVMCLAMLLGRLEIFTLLVIFTPRFWSR